MAWPAVGAAAIGAAGSYFGNKGSSHANDPITAEQQYLKSALPGVNNVMGQVGNLNPQQYYDGSTVAGMNPFLSNSINDMGGWGSGMGGRMMNQTYNAGNMALGAMGGGLNLMNTMQNQPGGPFQFNQGVYDQTMANAMPALQGSYDAATRDNNRQLNWNTLPGLDMMGTAAGAQGNTKLGQQSALAGGMTMDRNADIGASMYQNAVNQSINAGMNAGTQNLDANMGMVNQYGQYGQLGGDLMNQSYNMGIGNMNAGMTAGQTQQGYDQSVLDDDVARWNFNQSQPYDFLNNQLNLYNGGRSQSGGTGGGGVGMNGFEAATQGAQLGLGIYGAGRDAGWWGQPDALQFFDTSQYAGMMR
jgi:hypothetical protein